MSETPEVTPAAEAPKTPEASTEPQAAQTPPWGADFNAEKAWNLVQNLRSDKEKLSAREVLTPDAKQKLAEYDRLVEASKSELEKAQEAASKVTPLETENLRLKVALEKGLVGDRASLVDRLKGDSLDALRADADSLLELFQPAAPAGQQAPKPNPAQGASANGPAQPSQLTRQDLAGMSPEAINEARKEGRLNTVLGITS